MLEAYLEKAEKNVNVLTILGISFIVTFLLGFINSFIGKNSLFLVALVSLALSYPVISYIRGMNKEEIEKQMDANLLFSRHAKELVVFWTIFIGILFAFLILMKLNLVTEFTFQEQFYSKVSGMITMFNNSFGVILLNNLYVTFFTFLISFLSFAGLIFVISWNASILAYYLYHSETISNSLLSFISLLPHGLLEVGGYVLAGITGAILAYRIDRKNKFDHKLDSEFFKDFFLLAFSAIFLIFLAAFLEVIN